jgi:hypothetical protein
MKLDTGNFDLSSAFPEDKSQLLLVQKELFHDEVYLKRHVIREMGE